MDGERDLFGESEATGKSASIKEIILKYLAHFPLFIISLMVCLGAGILYVRYTAPKFKATTLILVKGSQGSQGGSKDIIGTALTGQLQGNLNNELIALRGRSLMTRVVSKNGFNISYYYQGDILKTDIYNDAPFRFIPQSIVDSNNTFSVVIRSLDSQGGTVEYGTKKDLKKVAFRWNEPITATGMTFILAKHADQFNKSSEYIVDWKPVWMTTNELASNTSVAILSEKTSIISIELLTENLKRGKDVLNSLVYEYNLADIEDRNIITQNTIRFIDDRLGIVSGELNGVESSMQNFQGSEDIVDIGTQQGQAFGNSNAASQGLQGLYVQQSVAKMITSYFTNPDNGDKLVPSTMGLNDPTLGALIGQYNQLEAQRQKEAAFTTKNSITLKDLNNQIDDVKSSILEALQNVNKNLRLQESSLQQQNNQYRQFLTSVPRKTRAMQDIKRKQSITEGLYLYLLQKREESAITSTSANVSNYKQIDPASGYGPVEPNASNIYMYSGLLGILLPLGFVFLRDMLNDRISSRDDITKRVPTPVLGDIGHAKTKVAGLVVSGRDIISEQFRIIRTNLALLKNKNKQVILVTSSASGEGKSFISTNLAGVLAIPGKRVALLEFDLRKPGILKDLQVNPDIKGITNFLKGQTDDLSDLYMTLEDTPTLHIYPSGPIPANPGDLLISERVAEFFERLKEQYDYIVVDTAPLGLVSDAFMLGEFSDISIFVVRQRVTLKKQVDFLSDIFKTKKLINIGVILNDVKTGGKYGYYGYGGGYGYENYKEMKKNRKKYSIT